MIETNFGLETENMYVSEKAALIKTRAISHILISGTIYYISPSLQDCRSRSRFGAGNNHHGETMKDVSNFFHFKIFPFEIYM